MKVESNGLNRPVGYLYLKICRGKFVFDHEIG